MSSEITDAVQIIHVLFEGADLCLRVTGKCLKPVVQLTKLIMGILAKEKMEGKTSMKNLLKRGGDMHVFKFPQEQLRKVEAMAKKYGILYSLLPDFGKAGMREIVFHAESLHRMNALIEKLKAGQVMGLEEYFQNASDRDIDKFFQKTRQGRTAEKEAGKETGDMQKNTASRGQEQKQPWMETGYLKMKDIEAIPLDQRLNILDHYQSGQYDPITITSRLIIDQKADHVVVKLPRQSGKFIRIPTEDFYFPEGSRTALAFLKKKEEMKVYAAQGSEMSTMKGNEIFHNYFDTVNANIRNAVEHKSDERETGHDSRENSNADRTSQPENRKPTKDTVEKAVKNTAEKTKNITREVKQPVRGR